MIKFLCGCKREADAFTFCSTHALSDEREAVNKRWRALYKPMDWDAYVSDMIKTLGLEQVDVSV